MPEVRVAAALIVNQLRCCEEEFGAEAVEAAIAKMPEAERQEMSDLTPIGWCRVSAAQRFHAALAEELRRPFDQVHRQIVVRGVERTFSTVWRIFLRFTSLAQIVKRASTVYGKSYDTGTMKATVVSREHVTAEVTGWPGMPEIEARGLALGIETVLLMSGKKTASVRAEPTRDGARLVATLTG